MIPAEPVIHVGIACANAVRGCNFVSVLLLATCWLGSGCASKTNGATLGSGGSSTAAGGSAMGGAGAANQAQGGNPATTGGSATTIVVGASGNAGTTSSENCVTSCNPLGGQWCGVIGDNCGGKLTCAPCPDDWTCEDHQCIGGSTCPRVTCEAGDRRYCGTLGDGCGGTLKCGECPDNGVCGGSGVANVCSRPNCTPQTCVDQKSGGHYCGDIGDGCGGVLHCGDCSDGKECGSDGTPNLCPGAPRCKNLQCTILADACPADSPTTLSGTVYDPAGKLPLYNALVYVPNDPLPLPPIPDGATCEQCAAYAAGTPIAVALTDVNGKFTLSGVPSGSNLPLVIQVGKWRREVTLNTSIDKCASNAISDPNLTRLPRKKAEGHIPRIAVTTGGYDALECLLRRIGISDEEFTTDAGEGRVHMYVGGPVGTDVNLQGADQFTPQLGGTSFPHATSLWSNADKLQGYDIMMLSCEGGQLETVKAPYRDNVFGYMNHGGRVFVDHLHFYWLMSGPAELQGTANYLGDKGDLPQPSTVLVDTSFPKGSALADWLVTTGASSTRGQITIYGGQRSVSAVNPPTQRWIYQQGTDPSVQYMTFNTPVTAPPENQCGRVVYTDIHIGASVRSETGGAALGGDQSSPKVPFPQGCANSEMSPQAKALEFMFFDLSACVMVGETPPPVTLPPAVPPPPLAVPPPPPPPPPPPR